MSLRMHWRYNWSYCHERTLSYSWVVGYHLRSVHSTCLGYWFQYWHMYVVRHIPVLWECTMLILSLTLMCHCSWILLKVNRCLVHYYVSVQCSSFEISNLCWYSDLIVVLVQLALLDHVSFWVDVSIEKEER